MIGQRGLVMLKSCYRLKSPKDFRRTYQKGKFITNPYLVVYFRKNRQSNYRIGFSVSKKIGKAVVRNRVKRRLREICRLNESLFPNGWDFIFVARVKIKDASYQTMEKSLINLMKRIREKK